MPDEPIPEVAPPPARARFLDSHPEIHEGQPRIYVKLRPAGTVLAFWTLLDTGAHYCLLNSAVASLIRGKLTESLGGFRVRTARGLIEGELYRHHITLIAEVGESLDFEATVFVPTQWDGPSFLGYAGALERVRFMIDPQTNQFLFGEV